MARLGDICKINMGQSPDSSTYNDHGIGLPFYQGNADFGEVYPSARVYCSSPVKVAQKGDILISVRAPIGALNMANEKCCIGRGLAAITANEDVCDRQYLWYVLLSKVEELNAEGTGSTFKAINRNILDETEIPLIPIDDQKQISDQLDKVVSLISLRKKQLQKLDDLIKSRFVEMFGDVIHNSKNWEKRNFSEIAASRLGKMLDGKKQTGKHSFPYLANSNVQWFRFDLSKMSTMDFDEKDRIEFELKDGDLLVCEGGEIGRCAVWHNEMQPCYFQKAIHRVRCDEMVVLPDYLSWWFKYQCEHDGFASIEGAKATIAHLPGAKLKALKVVVPSIELQKQFTAFIKTISNNRLTIHQGLDKLEQMKQALMQKYFG